MATRAAIADVTASIIAVCRQGHPPDRLKTEVLARLRRIVPVDALWWATSDPSTLLFTQAFAFAVTWHGMNLLGLPFLLSAGLLVCALLIGARVLPARSG